MDNSHEMEVHHITVTSTTKPLFHAGTVVVLSEAEAMLDKMTGGDRQKTTAMVGEFIRRHITGDFGLMPAENVAENIRRIVAENGDNIMGTYSLDGSRTEPYKTNEPAAANTITLITFVIDGDVITYVASSDEVHILYMGRSIQCFFRPDVAIKDSAKKGPSDPLRDLMIKLVGMAPAGHA